jgi:protein-tyrosine-phosphatase
MKIMFVCAGNTSRSAMAEAIFKKMNSDVEVFSSGIIAKTGKSPSQKTIDVCKSHGIDVSNHKATYFKDSNIENMDLVLTFERVHKSKIKIYYPDLVTYTIKEFVGEYPMDINDPVGGSVKVYDACFCEICRVLKKVNIKIGEQFEE